MASRYTREGQQFTRLKRLQTVLKRYYELVKVRNVSPTAWILGLCLLWLAAFAAAITP